MDRLHEMVSALMRQVAAEVMMPRFRALAADQVREKAPGDLVTVVDSESEARLTEGLLRLLPGSAVLGEEASAADEGLLGRAFDGPLWIVDPLDGTANFAAGTPPFAIMVALTEGGRTAAAWILDPVSGRMCHALAGAGAFIDGERVASHGSGAALPKAALASRFIPDDLRADYERRAEGTLAVVPIPGCAGEQYPRLVTGENDVAFFWRALPWDHAPGALFLSEAGGRVATIDGQAYRPDYRGFRLLAASTPELWDRAAAILTG